MADRPRDLIWDTLTDCFGIVRDKDARGRRNAAVARLREAGATPEEVLISYEWCKLKLPFFTEMAVCMYLDRALHERRQASTTADLFTEIERMAGRDDL